MSELIGRYAVSKAGHDKDWLYVIMGADERYYYLCDGKTRTLGNLKKKAQKHVELLQAFVAEELLERIQKKDKIFDFEIKYAIKMQEKRKEEGYVQK